ncbi:MAG: methionine--tRNA ligase [Microgenomates group bacterium]
MKKFFYITTTAPYVNADPHIGFALEIVQADTIARFKRLTGYDVAFGFGTDEHGLKIYRKALEEKKDPQAYCDHYAKKFQELKSALNLSTTHFIRTTHTSHIKAAQEFWRRCLKNGDIYKKNYRVKYCVGCELEKTDSELVNNRCPLHPHLKIEIYEEENYFFRFSKYQDKLLKFYEKNPNFILPQERFNEIKAFVKKGLRDFSISRLKEKMPWGIEVPEDPKHVMYVWFDALVFYISTLGWPNNKEEFKKWWPAVQVAGKDNLRQQTAIWQAMLMSAGLPNSKQIIIHGFISVDGQKMSKSLGNVVEPFKLVKKYGTDPLRYYLLREIPPFEDGDYSQRRMKEIYQSELANELGNLVSRLTKLGEEDNLSINDQVTEHWDTEIIEQFNSFKFNLILENIWKKIKSLNKKIDIFAPWNKKPEERKNFLVESLKQLNSIAFQLQPFLPETAEKIIQATSGKIKKIKPLFPRITC